MGLLVLDRVDHPERAVEPAVVVPVDRADGGVLDVGKGPLGAVVEHPGSEALYLQQPDHGLHQGVDAQPTVPIEGAMPSRSRCSVKRQLV